ncbi:MAG: hypothetical protein E7471_01825 [Ruminococcaceae bacterium]|nr:hypothetical protein [Oscillospiraceae bacterium]
MEDRVLLAQNDDYVRNELIKEYKNFILSSTGITLGRKVTEEDDACSVAMLAFNEAIDKFDESKGKFLSFAGICIRARLNDWLRKEYRQREGIIPFSSIGSSDAEETEFDVEDPRAEISDAAIEIECARSELEKYKISFFDLPQYSPKSFKTKLECQRVIKHLISDEEAIDSIKKKKTLPIKRIVEKTKVNEKLLERHRKYIIACVVILDGEYEIISDYLKFAKKGGVR